MPLQFVAQGPMLISAVVAGNVDILDSVPLKAYSNQSFLDPADFTGVTISSGTNTALIVVATTLSTPFTSIIWDPSGANQSLTKVAENTSTNYFAVYALLNPTPGASKAVRVAGQGGSTRVGLIAQTFKNVLQTSVAAAFTDISNTFTNTAHLTDAVTTTSGSAAFLMVQRTETSPLPHGPLMMSKSLRGRMQTTTLSGQNISYR